MDIMQTLHKNRSVIFSANVPVGPKARHAILVELRMQDENNCKISFFDSGGYFGETKKVPSRPGDPLNKSHKDKRSGEVQGLAPINFENAEVRPYTRTEINPKTLSEIVLQAKGYSSQTTPLTPQSSALVHPDVYAKLLPQVGILNWFQVIHSVTTVKALHMPQPSVWQAKQSAGNCEYKSILFYFKRRFTVPGDFDIIRGAILERARLQVEAINVEEFAKNDHGAQGPITPARLKTIQDDLSIPDASPFLNRRMNDEKESRDRLTQMLTLLREEIPRKCEKHCSKSVVRKDEI